MGKEKGEKGSEAKECAIVGHDEIVNGTVTVRLIENKASKKARGGVCGNIGKHIPGRGSSGANAMRKDCACGRGMLGWFTCLV